MQPTNDVSEYIASAGKLAPTGTIAGISAAGVSLQDWVYIVTIIYTVLMSLHLLFNWCKGRNGR